MNIARFFPPLNWLPRYHSGDLKGDLAAGLPPIYGLYTSLYFANASFLKDEINETMVEDPALKRLVFDAYPINDIDATGAETLKAIIEDFQENGYAFYFAGVKGPVVDVPKKAGVVDLVGNDHFFMEVHHAVEYVAQSDALPVLEELEGVETS